MHTVEHPSSASLDRAESSSLYDVHRRRPSLTSSSSPHSGSSSNRSKSITYPKSPRIGSASAANGYSDGSSRHVSANYNGNPARQASAGHLSSFYAAPHPVRSPSSSSNGNGSPSSAAGRSPVEVRHGKKSGQIWLPEGIVDMASFGPILSMDETDATREFSKTLISAWCDQAEMALEEMELHLHAGKLIPLAEKAHYLKGSSASLGLVKVATTCQSIYHIHFPPSLAHLRAFSYTGKGNSELSTKPQSPTSAGAAGAFSPSGSSSSGSSSGSSSSSSSSSLASSRMNSSVHSPATAYSSDSSIDSSPFTSFGGASEKMQYTSSASPRVSPMATVHEAFPFEQKAGSGTLSPSLGIYASHQYSPEGYATSPSSSVNSASKEKTEQDQEDIAAHFERLKLQRAQALLEKLRKDIKEGSSWLYTYYRESDRYAGIPTCDV